MRWVIGDVHGMLRPLERLIDAIDESDHDAKLIFVGDYVNRGPDSAGVLELLSDLDGAIFLRGNHDDVFDLLVNGKCEAPHPAYAEPVAAFLAFVQHGLDRTLLSYDVPVSTIEAALSRPSPATVAACFESVPQTHRDFIRDLPLSFDGGSFFVVHAYVDPNEPVVDLSKRFEVDETRRRLALWGRFTPEQLLAPKAWSRPGHFGHTSVEHYPASSRNGTLLPAVGPQITLVDTACALREDGVLTAVCPDNNTMIRVDRRGRTLGGP